LQRENAELKRAAAHVISNAMDMFDKIEREVEANKTRLDKILGRPIADTKLIDRLLGPQVTS
jgi:hypothetical protein